MGVESKVTVASSYDAAQAIEAARLAKQSIEQHNAGDFDEADKSLRRSLQMVPSFHDSQAPDVGFHRIAWEGWQEDHPAGELETTKLINLLSYSKAKRSDFDGQIFPSYYDVDIGPVHLDGLRKPKDRLDLVSIDFEGKTVLDVGCNFGGMILNQRIANSVKWGVGVDYDSRLINVANGLAGANMRFFVHDLECDPLELIRDMMPGKYVDVVFLLATCAHIKNWEAVIEFASSVSSVMVFEANGHEYEQLGQIRCLSRLYEVVDTLADKGAPGVGARRLFLCSNPSRDVKEHLGKPQEELPHGFDPAGRH